MSFLFRSKPKSPAELANILKDSSKALLPSSNISGKSHEKAYKDVTKSLNQLKALFNENDQDLELIAELAQESYSIGLLETLVDCLPWYDFEARKAAVIIFNGVLKRQIGSRTPTADYIYNNQEILMKLLKGYESKETALNSGMMLRECIKFEHLAQVLIESDEFYSLFDYIELPTFDVASDAFATFESLLMRHKMFAATLFVESYDRIMPELNKLLRSDNYVTRRQTLKLLVGIMADPLNAEMKSRYLTSSDNLKVVMNLMRDQSRTISSEAFRVFRDFLENPLRTKAVHDILLKNQEKLLNFMKNFEIESDDESLLEDRDFCISVVEDLVPRIEAQHSSTDEIETS